MDFNKFLQSKMFKRAVIAVGLLVIISVSFGTGLFVGYHKARFSYAWGENYDRNFGGPHRGIFGFLEGSEFTNAHGTFGTVVSVASSSFAINGRDNIEKTLLLSSTTSIREGHDALESADLRVGDAVVVIGNPNDQGEIEARLVRVLTAH